jgi:hypothetical protein
MNINLWLSHNTLKRFVFVYFSFFNYLTYRHKDITVQRYLSNKGKNGSPNTILKTQENTIKSWKGIIQNMWIQCTSKGVGVRLKTALYRDATTYCMFPCISISHLTSSSSFIYMPELAMSPFITALGSLWFINSLHQQLFNYYCILNIWDPLISRHNTLSLSCLGWPQWLLFLHH